MKIELLFECTYKVYVVVLEGKGHDCAHFLSEDWEAPNKRSEIAAISFSPRSSNWPKTQGTWQGPFIRYAMKFGSEQDQYRIPWFYDKGRIIICTHYFVKKKIRPPRRKKTAPRKIREEYKKGDRNEIRE